MQGAAGSPGGSDGGKSKKNLFQPSTPANTDEENKGPYLHLPRHGAAWLLIVGSLMLLLTVVTPWWSWTLNTSSQNADLDLFVWGIQCFGYSCPGYSPTPIYPPTTPTLQAGSFLSNLGVLYGTAAAMSVVAAIFGLVASLMLFRVARGQSTYNKAVDRTVLLSYLGVAIALSTPVMMAVAQTTSIRADYGFPFTLNPNPGVAFYGSVGAFTFAGVQYTSMSWGPSWGWFLSIFGGVFLFSGGFIPHLTRDEAVTRGDLIRQGLLKLRAPLRRALPTGPIRPGLPSPAAVGAGPRALPPPVRMTPPPAYGYPQYQSLAPGVGWARAPLPPAGGGQRPAPAPLAARPPPAALPAPSVARPGPPPVRAVPSPIVSPTASPAPRPAAGMTPLAQTPRAVQTPTGMAPPNAVGFAGRATVASRTAPSPVSAPATAAPTLTPASTAPRATAMPSAGSRICPKCLSTEPGGALRCSRCGFNFS